MSSFNQSHSEFTKNSFEDMLKKNLEPYIQEPEYSHHSFFQATREISYARFALTKQVEFYARAIEVYTELFDRWLSTPSTDASQDAKLLTNILHAISEVEQKSAKLIDSVRNVVALLGQAVSIDVDKAHLSTMLLRLPSLVRDAIEKASSDSDLAERVSCSVDSKLSELMIACRFNPESMSSTPQLPPAILQEEYEQMLNSIPAGPSPASTSLVVS